MDDCARWIRRPVEEIARAEPFLPPNGKPYSLNLYNNVLYTTTAQGCGGTPNQFYGYDLATKKVGSFNPGSGGMWPRLGPSIGKDGSVYAGSGDGDYFPERQIYGQSIVAVKQNPETKALEMTDWYAPSNAYWLRKRDLDINATGPVFEYKGKEYTVQTSKECRVWLLDTSGLGGEDHRTPDYRTPLICNEEVQFAGAGVWGALATWEEADGTRWILVPFWGPKHSQFTAPIEHGPVVQGAVAAFKMEEKDGKPQLTPAWLSRNMWQADPVVIANGVVFAYGNGEDATQATFDGGLGTTRRRIASRNRGTPRCTRSTREPAPNCGRAATRSRRSATSAVWRSRMAASISGRTTARCIASASSRRRRSSHAQTTRPATHPCRHCWFRRPSPFCTRKAAAVASGRRAASTRSAAAGCAATRASRRTPCRRASSRSCGR